MGIHGDIGYVEEDSISDGHTPGVGKNPPSGEPNPELKFDRSTLNDENIDFFGVAGQVKEYCYKRGFSYVQGVGKAAIDQSSNIDCSGFVTASIYEYAISKANISSGDKQKYYEAMANDISDGNGGGNAQKWSGYFRNMKGDTNFFVKEISKEDLKRGDILTYSNHVEIYAGEDDDNKKPFVLNCGGNGSINQPGITRSGRNIKDTYCVLHVVSYEEFLKEHPEGYEKYINDELDMKKT